MYSHRSLRPFCLILLFVGTLMMLMSCSASTLPLPEVIQADALGYSTVNEEWTTVSDLANAADCVVSAKVISAEPFSDNGTWRYQMQVVQDLSNNVNTTGCAPDTIYVYTWDGDAYALQKEYILFLKQATIKAYPHIVYTELVPSMCIDISDTTSVFSLRESVAWESSSAVLNAAKRAAEEANAPAILYIDTVASYAEALDAADEIWLIEIDAFVSNVNEYLDKYDYTILQVLKGSYDITQPGAESYRESLPVSSQVEVGQQYLLLKEHTPGGMAHVSGEYSLISAESAFFQQAIDAYSPVE